jgi:cation diffusion facilitator CzcD-associated flavoprotein CzcO
LETCNGEKMDLKGALQGNGNNGAVADIEIAIDARGKQFARDPWVQQQEASSFPGAGLESHGQDREASPGSTAQADRLIMQEHHRVLIIGAGHGGLLFAVRLLETKAFSPQDILIVDEAAGFGGTWYWNRYPGLMCDTESYIYMPLLAETGYMPREKYSSGCELREHAERIARLYGLHDRALFRAGVRALEWDEQSNVWHAALQLLDKSEKMISLSANFTILATGLFASPRIPHFPGLLDTYKGVIFHPARWDYAFTGGTPESPKMTRLQDKTVAIIGTGASAVQIVPQLARFAKRLLVLQRTPASVDYRNNRPTDPVWWRRETKHPGWQRRRMENFNAFTASQEPAPPVNLVGDAWTAMASYSIIIGSKHILEMGFIGKIAAADRERQAQIRERVRGIVQDVQTARLLGARYPGWCKRPCFHDEYLPTFNRPNVQLIEIPSPPQRGISHFTSEGIVVDGKEYKTDAVILSTGYTTPHIRNSPGSRANIAVVGRNGLTMEHKWQNGLATLHGIATRGLPNLFFPGPFQSGVSTNQTYTLDQLAGHVAYIMSEAVRRVGSSSATSVIVEPSADAEESWAQRVLRGATTLAPLASCIDALGRAPTSGRAASIDEQATAARLTTWREGIATYVEELEAWRAAGELEGFELTPVL